MRKLTFLVDCAKSLFDNRGAILGTHSLRSLGLDGDLKAFEGRVLLLRHTSFWKVDALEPSQDRAQVRALLPDVRGMIVRRNDDQLGTDGASAGTLNLSVEGVTISPEFEEMTQASMIAVKVFDDDSVFIFVAAPPLIAAFEPGFRVVLAGFPGLPGPGRTVVPEVFGLSVRQSPPALCFQTVPVDALVLEESNVFWNVIQAAVLGSQTDVQPTFLLSHALLGVDLGGLSTFRDVAFFFAVGDALEQVPTGLQMAARELLLESRQGQLILEADGALEMGGSTRCNFFAVHDVPAVNGILQSRAVVVVVSEGKVPEPRHFEGG